MITCSQQVSLLLCIWTLTFYVLALGDTNYKETSDLLLPLTSESIVANYISLPSPTVAEDGILLKQRQYAQNRNNSIINDEITFKLKPLQLKEVLYSLLDTVKSQPTAAVEALLLGDAENLPRKGPAASTTTQDDIQAITHHLDTWLDNQRHHLVEKTGLPVDPDTDESTVLGPQNKATSGATSKLAGVLEGRSHRIDRSNKGVMYLPINQPQADPCAAPKGSKLLQALPLVFLSSVMSVADAIGNVVNNINNNNRNNNNNNDNNVNNDNTNLAANINNANQINLVPMGGRALRMARALMDAIGRMALGLYHTILPPAVGGDAADSESSVDTAGNSSVIVGHETGNTAGIDTKGNRNSIMATVSIANRNETAVK